MDMEKRLIKKIRMELANKNLERRAAKIKDVPMFRGVPAHNFDKKHLVMLCSCFADGWHKAQVKYLELLQPLLPADRIKTVLHHLQADHKPSIWRRIWTWIKS